VRVELDGLFIDMYGTLTTGDRAAVEATCAQIIADTDVPLSAQELSILWGERFFAAMEHANLDAFETLFALEARTLRETMAVFGMRVAPEPYVARLVAYWRQPPLQPDTRDFLAGLRIPVWIVSNADRAICWQPWNTWTCPWPAYPPRKTPAPTSLIAESSTRPWRTPAGDANEFCTWETRCTATWAER